MKNNITKISAALSFSLVMLLMMGCPSKKQTDQSGDKEPVDTTHLTSSKDSIKWHYKEIMKNYDTHFNMKLMSHNDTILFLDSVQSIAATFFDCNESNETLREHELPYNEAFAYILHFQDMYRILACAEIPVGVADPFREIRHADHKAEDNCGMLLYMGIDPGNMFSIAYHNEANVVSDAWRLFPRTSTAFEFFRADCQNTSRTPIPNPNDLNNEITRYSKICAWTLPAATYTNDEINRNGFELLTQLSVLQPPIAFFHAQEIANLISQNDGATEDTYKCTGIRFYYGYDNDVTNPIKIKLIAFAIDGNGKNIIFRYDGTPAFMLERSWPPN